MGVEVRTIVDDEIEAFTSARNNGFMRPAAEGAAEFMRESDQDLDRCWAGFDGTSVVATLRSFATPLTLPGGAMVPTAALTSVTTKATHRRQGLLNIRPKGFAVDRAVEHARRGDPVMTQRGD